MVKYPETSLLDSVALKSPEKEPAVVDPEPEQAKSSFSSLPPGALTQISNSYNETPAVEEIEDKKAADLNSSGATPNLVDESDLVKVTVEIANNLEESPPVNIFKGSFRERENQLTSRQLPSTRYNEEEECSIIEPKSSTLDQKSSMPIPNSSSSDNKEASLKRPKAQRGITAKESVIPFKRHEYQTDIEGPKRKAKQASRRSS